MAVLSFLAAVSLIFSACAPEPGEEPKQIASENQPRWETSGELFWDAGELSYLLDDELQWAHPLPEVLPYKIVTAGSPILLTTVDQNLKLTTYALGQKAQPYPGMFPLLADDGWAVLAELPGNSVTMAMAVKLLDLTGETSWDHSSALALWPDATNTAPDTIYLALTGEIEPAVNPLIFPLGQSPLLTAVALAGGDQLWTKPVPTDYPVADVRLLALGETHGLLSLQYDYLIFDLVSFRLSDAKITGRHRLQGVVEQRLIYPGPEGELVDVNVTGDTARMLVRVEGAGLRYWEINLASGDLVDKAAAGSDNANREENDLPVAGAGSPGPGNHPFSQEVLPVAGENSWRIPALADEAGRIVVVTKDGVVFLSRQGT